MSCVVVVNDCAAVPVTGGPVAVRTRKTSYGERNFQLNFGHVAEGLPRQFTDREMDWLETIAHLFAVDLACQRGEGDVAWARDIEAYLPVRDPEYWNGITTAIEGIFSDFTFDRLRLHFVQEADPIAPPRQRTQAFHDHDCVALLSGGVDSYVGAARLLAEGRIPLAVSHTAAGAISHAQSEVEHVLVRQSPTFERAGLTARKLGATFPAPEPSQRSRSFLFLAAALAAAAVLEVDEVFINENGVMAIHVPMTPARLGSLSTHTASPLVMSRVASLASEVLGRDLAISNNLLTLTKPEVVEVGASLGLADSLSVTVSCWAIGRTSEHCGVCAPCMMRRISFLLAGVDDAVYTTDIFSDPAALERDSAADNLVHLVRLIQEIEAGSDLELQLSYPELLNGGSALSVDDTLDLYRRWAGQAASILFQHPIPNSVR